MKTIVSAATLTIALGFGGTAFAQAVTLGAQTVTEANMPQVQARCDELSAESTAAVEGSENNDDATASADAGATATTGTTTDNSTGTSGSASGGTGDATTGSNANATTSGSATAGSTTEGTTEQGTEEGTAGLIEIDTITLEQCVEAGLITN